MAKDPRFIGFLTFHSSDDNALISAETCKGKRDAKEHAAHLATQYGPIIIRRDSKIIATVDETYLDR